MTPLTRQIHSVWIGAAALLAASCVRPPPAVTGEIWTLDAPAAGEGFQLRLPTFEVPYGHEEQSCYFVRGPDPANRAAPTWWFLYRLK